MCCSCAPGHHLDRDGRHCSELHPCDTWGACSQLCRRVSRARHKCYCHPGHVLQPDKFSCKSRDPSQPRIVFSTRHELRTIDLRRSVARPLLSSLQDTIVMDFLQGPGSAWLFWTDWAEDR